MVTIEMLNDEGAVTEERQAHECIGGEDECETPAVCEDHGDVASPDNPVLVWTCLDGMTFFACSNALASDDYARIKR